MAISVQSFYDELSNNNIEFFAGVPDSLLKNLCGYIDDTVDSEKHHITANEGGAIAMGIGYHLATNSVPLVYMQNSGLGNIVNPVLSMVDDMVYGIPMVLVVGWRGEVLADNTQLKDEPQHAKQGLITLQMLDSMGIKYLVVDENTDLSTGVVGDLINHAKDNSVPVCIVVRKGAFESYKQQSENNGFEMTREQSIECIVDSLESDDLIVSTTGMISRELFETRKKKNQSHDTDFLVVGGMGHASQVATGVLVGNPNKTVYCLDGDGGFLMHMGSITNNADHAIKHIVINNGAHDSVGGQSTKSFDINIPNIALSSGYTFAKQVRTKDELISALAELKQLNSAGLIEVLVNKGSRPDLGRPTQTPKQTKDGFKTNF